MVLQIPCDLPFPLIPWHCPMLKSGWSCLFSLGKCVFGSRAQALTIPSDCRARSLSSLLTSSEEGRKGLLFPLCGWGNWGSHITHTHTHAHTCKNEKYIVVQINPLIPLSHGNVSKVPVPIWEPWEDHSPGAPSWRWRKTAKEAES